MKKEIRAAITGAAVGLLIGAAWMWANVIQIDTEISAGYERLNQDDKELAIRAEYWKQNGRPDLAELCK